MGAARDDSADPTRTRSRTRSAHPTRPSLHPVSPLKARHSFRRCFAILMVHRDSKGSAVPWMS